MTTLKFEIQINAPVNKVYRTMLGLDSVNTYNEWTKAFNPTSTYEGTWEKGSKIHFIGINKEGKREGMVSEIVENIPDKFVSIKHIGVLDGDIEITEGAAVEQWAGGLENYTLEDTNGVTKVSVESDTNEEYKSFFETVWPQALNILKEICEK